MVTTKQVRAVMQKYIALENIKWPVYTNKTSGHTGRERRVKCYALFNAKNNAKMLKELRTLAGAENVTETPGVEFDGRGGMYDGCGGITVKCHLAKR